MARPRLFSFFNRLPDASAIVPPPFAAVEPPAAAQAQDAVVAGLTAKLAEVTAERDQTAAALTAAQTALATAEQTNVAQSVQISALTTERDTFKLAAEQTREAIVQEVRNQEMATLAASQGIPANAEIVPSNGPGKSKSDELTEVLAEIKASKDPAQKGILAVKAANIRADIRAGK